MKRRQFVQGVGATTLGLQWGQEAQAFASERKMTPLEAFIDGPLLSNYTLSPDGKTLAAVIINGDKTSVITRDLATGEMKSVLQTDNLEQMFNWIRWKNDHRLLISVLVPLVRDLGSYNGRIETMETRLYAINADGSKPVNMYRKRAGDLTNQMEWTQDRVIDWLPDDPDHVLMVFRESERDLSTAVYKVNVNTAERSVHQPPRDVLHYLCTDAQHRARVGSIWDKNDGKTTLWVCDPDGDRWRKLAVDKGPFDGASIDPLGFGLDPNILYVAARVNGLRAVHTMDLREDPPSLKIKIADPDQDLYGSLLYDPHGEAVGISQVDAGTGSSRFYWEPSFKQLQEQFDAALPKRWNYLADLSRYGGRYLLTSTVPGLPTSLMIGSLVTGKLENFSSQFPDLEPKRIARKKPFQFKARDGFALHAFLTLPLDSKPQNLPLVVLPHGGPQSHDTTRFDQLVAFIADRGYAVLQVNFRGSTGYGFEYRQAGLRRCGLETQDDVTDGVKKLIADGVADPTRVSIVGWSFGGYAALNGVIKDPDLYRGAFAIAPIANLIDWVSDWRSLGQREVFRQQIGDSRDDAEQLRATSPVFHAEKVKVPVVILHGTLDRQAEYSQSVQMDEALTKAGKKHKFISFDKGDHQLSHRPYRLRMYTELEAFLKETLGPGAPADA